MKHVGFTLQDRPQSVRVTRPLIQEFSNLNVLSRDRNFSDKRFKALKAKLDADQMLPIVWASAYCEENGLTYRVNGQHTTKLLASYPFESISHLYITVHRYVCRTLEDVAVLTSQFDSRISVKTTTDIFGSFSSTVEELKDVPQHIINATLPGLHISVHDDLKAQGKNTIEEKAALCTEHTGFIRWMVQFLRNKTDRRIFRRAPVIAAMHKMYVESQRQAEEFLIPLRDGTEPAASPTGRLREFLLTHGFSGRHGETKITPVTGEIMHNVVLQVWQSWRWGVTVMKKPINPKHKCYAYPPDSSAKQPSDLDVA